MDTLIQSYMEETEDMLQKAEECIIKLETDYSSADVNELFRIAHTIKGSSHMVGYEDIGNLMHSIEDMLDLVRNDSIPFDPSIVSLCFAGLDLVKKMLQGKTDSCSSDLMEELEEDSSKLREKIEHFTKSNMKEKEKNVIEPNELGIVSGLLMKEQKGKYKYYITLTIEEDAPMISPVLMIVFKSIEDIGTLVYASVTDQFFNGGENDKNLRNFDLILCTDFEEAELYTYFALFYVEKINIINISRSLHEKNDYYYGETDYSPYIIIFKVIMKLYQLVSKESNDKELKGVEVQKLVTELSKQAVDAFSRIKNKDKSKAYIMNFQASIDSVIMGENAGLEDRDLKKQQEQIIKLIEQLYLQTKGKYIIRIIKSEQDNFIQGLKNFIGLVNKNSTLIILIDISNLDILHENELKEFIGIFKELQDKGIEIGLISDGPHVRRLVNIFDSIKPVCDLKLFASELEAILGLFQADDSYQRIMNRITELVSV